MIGAETFALYLVAMGVAAFGCRLAGHLLMRHVAMTPRVEAALRATPAGVMAGILALSCLNGGPAEWVGAAAAVLAMRATGQDVSAAFVGVAVVALMRAAGL